MNNNGSRRMRRMERHHKLSKASPLNLVSLMDIFTILVFFLLVNSSSAPQLPNAKDLSLPKSVAKKAPKENLILAITPNSLLIQGREIISLTEVMKNEQEVIEVLKKELEFQAANKKSLVSIAGIDEEPKGHAITIMGDENVPYEVLHKILATCQQSNYTEIAFAAHQKAKKVVQ